jgi:hypothetical protein
MISRGKLGYDHVESGVAVARPDALRDRPLGRLATVGTPARRRVTALTSAVAPAPQLRWSTGT